MGWEAVKKLPMRKTNGNELWSGDSKVMEKGNPTKITRRQHIFPRSVIEGFADKNGKVKVVPVSGKPIYFASSHDPRFTVERLWDQKCEEHSNELYEAPFHLLAQKLLATNTQQLNSDEGHVASGMYGLWRARTRLKRNPPIDSVLTALSCPKSASGWSQSEGEQLEKAGFVLTQEISNDGHPIVRSRFNVWPKLLKEVELFKRNYQNYNWAVLNDNARQIVIPDQCPETIAIPLSPTRCLAMINPNSDMKKLSTDSLSERLKSAAKVYWIQAT